MAASSNGGAETPLKPADKPLILVCNDDGITAPGIAALTRVARKHGHVEVVAPDSPQSGMGHAISIHDPLRARRHYPDPDDGIRRFACSGTPADCIKLATGELLKRPPTLVVSGINHGANASVAVLYSGTMSAAIEAAIDGIPAIGFSLCDFTYDADFATAEFVADRVIGKALEQIRAGSFPKHVALNVNIPAVPLAELKGIKVTRQADGHFVEEFDHRRDPYNRHYYWLVGEFKLRDSGTDTDTWAIDHGYASVCPVKPDMTAHHVLGDLNQWGFNANPEGNATPETDAHAQVGGLG